MHTSSKAWVGSLAAIRIHWSCAVLACAVSIVPTPANAAGPEGSVVVNGVPLASDLVFKLESYYRTPIARGRYWYDTVSGAWGFEGRPIAGQLAPGMHLGGPLRADASNGNTRVFINGRELAMVEVQGLEQVCRTPVRRGRYWVNARGVGSYDGRPPFFNLAECGRRGAAGSGTDCQNYGNGQFNCSSSRTGLGVIGEGAGKGGVFIDGKVISTPN